MLECQYLENRGPKIQDYVISCNSNICTLVVVVSTTDYIPDHVLWLHYVVNSTTSVRVRLKCTEVPAYLLSLLSPLSQLESSAVFNRKFNYQSLHVRSYKIMYA